jgi:hypothetical protein
MTALYRWGAIAALCLVSAHAFAQDATTDGALFDTIDELDLALFETFNECQDPDALARHEAFFAEDVEFYHDQGGATFDRDAMIAATRDNACGNYWRERIEGTLEVHPVPGFGAIAIGEHRFCEFATGDCPGVADFTTVWRKDEDRWRVTRVLSYGHRPSE